MAPIFFISRPLKPPGTPIKDPEDAKILYIRDLGFPRGLKDFGLGLKQAVSYWLLTQLFNFWGSYKVVESESFNFYFLGFWASEV